MAAQVITFHYDLKNEKKEILESSREGKPVSFLEGVGQIIPGLEKELVKIAIGRTEEVFVPYQGAYGPYDQGLVVEVLRKEFPAKQINAGDFFEIEKGGDIRVVKVIEVNEQTVSIDANHPMAGQDLIFVVEIIGRRDASPEEISHGHAHEGNDRH